MLTTPTHHNRRLRAGAVLATFGLGLPVGIAPALAETLTARAQVEVAASAITGADTADSDDEGRLAGAAQVAADISLDGYLDGLLGGSGDGPGGSGIPDTALLSDVTATAAATGALVLDIADGGVGGGAGDTDLPDGALPDLGLPGVGLPNLGVPELGLPGLGLPGLVLPGLGLPGAGLPSHGLPSLGLPGLGLPSLPDRLPSQVLPSVINPASPGQDDPAVVNAGHLGPVGGLVNGTGGKPGNGPVSGAVTAESSYLGPSQSVADSPGSLPRTGANLRLRALAAFGLLGLAGLGGRRRRSA